MSITLNGPKLHPNLTVGGYGGVVAEGGVGGAVVLQGGQLLFTVSHPLFRTLEMLPEFHNLLKETEERSQRL